jgi:WD40 repeat protein
MGCVSDDGRKIASFAADHIEIWDVPSQTLDTTLMTGPPIAFSPDGRTLLTHGTPVAGPFVDTMELAFWDVASRRELFRIETTAQLNGMKAQFARDAKALVLSCPGAWDWSPTVWDVEKSCKKMSLPAVGSWNLVQDDNVLIGIGQDESKTSCLQFWDVASGQEVHSIRLEVADERWQGVDETSLQVSPDGRFLAFSTGSETKPRLLPRQLPQWNWLRNLWEGDSGKLRVLAEVTLLDVATKQKVGTISGASERGLYSFSQDGRMFASLQDNGAVAVWEVPPRKPRGLALALSSLVVLVVWAGRLAYRRRRARAPAT